MILWGHLRYDSNLQGRHRHLMFVHACICSFSPPAGCLSTPFKHACAGRLPARAQLPTEDQQCFSAQKVSLSYGLQADADWSQVTSTMAGDAQQRIALTVLPNQFLIKTVQELGRMPFTEFTSLYSVRQRTLLTWLHSATVHTK